MAVDFTEFPNELVICMQAGCSPGHPLTPTFCLGISHKLETVSNDAVRSMRYLSLDEVKERVAGLNATVAEYEASIRSRMDTDDVVVADLRARLDAAERVVEAARAAADAPTDDDAPLDAFDGVLAAYDAAYTGKGRKPAPVVSTAPEMRHVVPIVPYTCACGWVGPNAVELLTQGVGTILEVAWRCPSCQKRVGDNVKFAGQS